MEAKRREREQRIRDMMEYQEAERARIAERQAEASSSSLSTYARIEVIRRKNQERP